MKNKRYSLLKSSTLSFHALLFLYSTVVIIHDSFAYDTYNTYDTYNSGGYGSVSNSGGGIVSYRDSKISRRPAFKQRIESRQTPEIYKSRRRSGYSDTGISHVVPDKKNTVSPQKSYNRKSAVVGSVHHSGASIQATQNNMAYTMTMSYRPGDGVKFSAEEKKYVEAIRNSNIDDSLQTITKELHGFLENNWPGWRDNWGDYYLDLSILANIGSTVDNLPEQHEIIKIKDLTYYYAGGVYYAKFKDIYVVVPPPYGAITGTMPAEYTTVYVGDTAFFNCGGAFYVKVDDGYQAVAPPVGAIVNELPRKAYSTLIGKNVYSVYGTAYYKRFFRGNSVIYKIVKTPEVKKTVS